MDKKAKTKYHFNKYAKDYDLYAELQRKIARELSVLFLPNIQEADLILDAGCGTGYIHELIRKRKILNNIYQLDIAFNMCEIARNYSDISRSYTVNSDIEYLPFKEVSFNLIISSLALQWTNIEVSIKNFYKILKKNGKIFISVFAKDSLYELAESFIQLDRSNRVINFPTKDEIFQLLVIEKFHDINIKEISITNFYQTSLQIMREIKSIGASYNGKRQPGLTSNKLKDLDNIYKELYGVDEKLPLTWNFLLIEAVK